MKRQLKNKWRYYALLTAMFVVCAFVEGQAQDAPPMPKACETPPLGFQKGGSFFVIEADCSSEEEPNIEIVAKNYADLDLGYFESVKYVFGATENIDLTSATLETVAGVYKGVNFQASKIMEPGVHWIIQIGEKEGTQYLKCHKTEIIKPEKPVANVFSCDGTIVNLEIEDTPKNDHNLYKVNWGDGHEDIINISYEYPLPYTGTHTYDSDLATVTITGTYTRSALQSCESDPVLASPFDSDAPLINSLEENDKNIIQLAYKDYNDEKDYTVEAALSESLPYEWQILGSTTEGKYTVTALENPEDYCYRISNLNNCDLKVYSNEICALNLTASQTSSSSASLAWNLPDGSPDELTLERDVKDCDDCLKPLPLTSTNDLSFDDNNLECDHIYNYKIAAVYSTTVGEVVETIQITSKSLEVNPLDGASKVTPNGLFYASYTTLDETKISLNIKDEEEDAKYHYYRKSANDVEFLPIGDALNSFIDTNVIANSGSYCYKYQIEDACDIKSELSPAFCTIFLSTDNGLLKWTDSSFPENILTSEAAEYTIQKYNDDLGLFLDIETTSELSFNISEYISETTSPTLSFRVLSRRFVEQSNFSIPSYSNSVELSVPAAVFTPTAFSPGGYNKYFKIEAKFVNEATITIYDRNNSSIFSDSIKGDGWDGNYYNGNPAPIGNYSYIIKGLSDSGAEFSKRGTVALLR